MLHIIPRETVRLCCGNADEVQKCCALLCQENTTPMTGVVIWILKNDGGFTYPAFHSQLCFLSCVPVEALARA